MVVINLKRVFKLFFAAALFLNASLCAIKAASSLPIINDDDAVYSGLDDEQVSKVKGFFKALKFDKNNFAGNKCTQTTAYLVIPDLFKNVGRTFADRIKEIGFDFFKDLFKTIIKKEFEFKDEYYVFYHGQRREFALPQNIYEGLYKIIYKKYLFDFIILRVPNKDFSKYGLVKDFLKKYIKNREIFDVFDAQPRIGRRLLSVNASLFGNTSMAWGGECTFDYFIQGYSVAPIDVTDLASEIFNLFDLNSVFDLYRERIKELEVLLADYENDKTGLLLQIFVPKKMIDDIAYRCIPGGHLYYKDETPWKHSISTYLEDCLGNCYWKNATRSLLPENITKTVEYAYYSPGWLFDEGTWRCRLLRPWLNKFYYFLYRDIDSSQFRLLVNESMLNPESGVKIFRYCNETDKFKEYKEMLNKLLSNIEQEYLGLIN